MSGRHPTHDPEDNRMQEQILDHTEEEGGEDLSIYCDECGSLDPHKKDGLCRNCRGIVSDEGGPSGY